jgi:hypothetical protein
MVKIECRWMLVVTTIFTASRNLNSVQPEFVSLRCFPFSQLVVPAICITPAVGISTGSFYNPAPLAYTLLACIFIAVNSGNKILLILRETTTAFLAGFNFYTVKEKPRPAL